MGGNLHYDYTPGCDSPDFSALWVSIAIRDFGFDFSRSERFFVSLASLFSRVQAPAGNQVRDRDITAWGGSPRCAFEKDWGCDTIQEQGTAPRGVWEAVPCSLISSEGIAFGRWPVQDGATGCSASPQSLSSSTPRSSPLLCTPPLGASRTQSNRGMKL